MTPFPYKDGGLVKTLLHSAIGAGIAAINDEDILVGALSQEIGAGDNDNQKFHK